MELQTDAVYHSAECVVLSWPWKASCPVVWWSGPLHPLCALSDLSPSILSSAWRLRVLQCEGRLCSYVSLDVLKPAWSRRFVHVAAQTTAWWRGRSKPVRCHAFPATGLEVKGSSPLPPQWWREGGTAGRLLNSGAAMTNTAEIWLIAPSWGWTRLALAPCTKCPAFFTSGPRMLSQPKATADRLASSLGGPWPQEAIDNREPQGQRSYWVGVNGLFLPSLLCLSYDSFRALHLLMNAKGLGRMQFFKGFLF